MRQPATTFFLIVLLTVTALAWLSGSRTGKRIVAHQVPEIRTDYKPPSKEFEKIQGKAFAAKSFITLNGFDTSFCFLVDMSQPGNHKRFFIYDFKKDTIENSGLVAHGNCNQYWLEGRKYGNEIGCGCTSLGRYRIGKSYYGRFGLAFKLYGLDKTNSNAFNRYVVLHAHDCMPDHEVEEEVCQSNGCPMVSPQFLKLLEPMIKNAKSPILLWIFE
jgi:L,D-transpeptidase catalytic domain